MTEDLNVELDYDCVVIEEVCIIVQLLVEAVFVLIVASNGALAACVPFRWYAHSKCAQMVGKNCMRPRSAAAPIAPAVACAMCGFASRVRGLRRI